MFKRESNLTVWKIGDRGAPPGNTPDPDILRWCEENDFILITNNRKSMPGHLSDHIANEPHVSGIFELNPNMSIGETIDELLLIWGASEARAYRDLIVYLPIS